MADNIESVSIKTPLLRFDKVLDIAKAVLCTYNYFDAAVFM